MRTKQTVKFPLSKVAETKVRVDYKTHHNLQKNASMESVYRNLGIFNQAHAYHAMVDLYNQRIEQENSVITQQRRIIKEEKSNVKKENKNHFTQLSYSDAFETINKQKSSQKIISNIFTKKIIKTRQNITASQSTFKSYETFTIPCYDGWYQDKMRKILKSIGHGTEGTIPIEMCKKDVVRYAKQTLKYTENFMTESFRKYHNVRVYCTMNYKCYDEREDTDDEKAHFIFKRNIGRVDITNFKEFQKYYVNGMINGFNEAMGKDYVICYGIDIVDVNIVKYNPLAWSGSSYTALPKIIYDTKAVINIKNIDQKCFLYSLIASRHTPKDHAERVTHYQKETLMSEFKYKDADFPMPLSKIPFFEKRNNVTIHVYTVEEDDKTRISLYRSKADHKEIINLFYYNNHYSLIKNWSRFTGSDKQHVCPNCFWKYSNTECFNKHLINCHNLNENGSLVKMPSDSIVRNKKTGKDFTVKSQTFFNDYK